MGEKTYEAIGNLIRIGEDKNKITIVKEGYEIAKQERGFTENERRFIKECITDPYGIDAYFLKAISRPEHSYYGIRYNELKEKVEKEQYLSAEEMGEMNELYTMLQELRFAERIARGDYI